MNPKSQDELKVFIASRETVCAECAADMRYHACAKALDEGAVRLAVTAHVCHAETIYDELFLRMIDRSEARLLVSDAVSEVLFRWKFGGW